MAKLMSKSELVQKIAERHPNSMTRKDVKSVIESLAEIGYKELKKTGAFFVPGFAKFVVIKKPATKARKGINPFTKEPTIFKAKPARKIIRARPVKAARPPRRSIVAARADVWRATKPGRSPMPHCGVSGPSGGSDELPKPSGNRFDAELRRSRVVSTTLPATAAARAFCSCIWPFASR